MILTKPHQIEAYRLLAIKARLGLELKGLKFSGRSTFAIVKEEFKLKGSRQSVYDQYIILLHEKRILS